jgi:hypothetical protein
VDGRSAAPRRPGRGAPASAVLRSERGARLVGEVVETVQHC